MSKLAILIVLALTLVLPAAAEGATPTFEAATFNATAGATSDLDLDLAISADNAAPARIVIYVPQGYTLNIGVAAGTSVGTIDATAVVGGTSLQIPEGKIVADNPSNFVANACAPGAHAAVRGALDRGRPRLLPVLDVRSHRRLDQSEHEGDLHLARARHSVHRRNRDAE